jgi:hypothetical protein
LGEDGSFERKYNASGSSDQTRIRAKAVAEIPASYEGLVLLNIDIDPDPVTIDSANNKGLWLVTGNYRPPLLKGARQAFDTSGGTFHISQSLFTREFKALPKKTPTNRYGSINDTGEKVEGVDIVVQVYEFSETYLFSPFVMTPSYRITLFHLTGRINERKFRGFVTGEVLFKGASGSLDDQGFYQVEFKFAASPGREKFFIGEIPITLKQGWDYAWVNYEKVRDPDSGKPAHRPVEAYIEQVYEYGNFGSLGIGTGLNPTPPP